MTPPVQDYSLATESPEGLLRNALMILEANSQLSVGQQNVSGCVVLRPEDVYAIRRLLQGALALLEAPR